MNIGKSLKGEFQDSHLRLETLGGKIIFIVILKLEIRNSPKGQVKTSARLYGHNSDDSDAVCSNHIHIRFPRLLMACMYISMYNAH